MSRLVRNTAYLTLASIAQKAVAFLYFTYIARSIGDSSTGAYFLALALTTTMGVFLDLGLTPVLIREVAGKPERAREALRTILGYKVLVAPLTVIVAILLPALLGYSALATSLVSIAVVVMLLDTLTLSLYGVLRGLHVLKYESIGLLVGQSTTAMFGIAVLVSGSHDLRLLIVALLVGSFWNAVYPAVIVARRLGIGALLPKLPKDLIYLKVGLAFFLSAVLVKISSYADSVMINHVVGQAGVGDYSAAYKLTYAFQFLPLAFVGALYPAFAAEAGDHAKLRDMLSRALSYTALLSAPICFGIAALAPEIVNTFYRSDFGEAVPVLRVLIFVLPFIFLDFPVGALLNATHRERTKTAIIGVTTLINVVANVVFVPIFGLMGAAFAALLSFGFMFVAGLIAVERAIDFPSRALWRAVGPWYLAGAVMAGVVLAAKLVMPWYATIPVGGVVFFLIASLLGAFKRADIVTALSSLKRRVV